MLKATDVAKAKQRRVFDTPNLPAEWTLRGYKTNHATFIITIFPNVTLNNSRHPGLTGRARSNSATYADPRLVRGICKGHHKGNHSTNARKAQYDAAVRGILPPERVKLWDACEKDSWRPVRTSSSDWALELAYLKTLWWRKSH